MKYSAGWKYKTEEPVTVVVSELDGWYVTDSWGTLDNGVVSIPKNYAWDGASFVLFKWFGTPNKWKTPSLVHDRLYQWIRIGRFTEEDRKPFDITFYNLLRKRRVNRLLALLAYGAVRIRGKYAVQHGPRIKVVD